MELYDYCTVYLKNLMISFGLESLDLDLLFTVYSVHSCVLITHDGLMRNPHTHLGTTASPIPIAP
jgi:hypothetical protein